MFSNKLFSNNFFFFIKFVYFIDDFQCECLELKYLNLKLVLKTVEYRRDSINILRTRQMKHVTFTNKHTRTLHITCVANSNNKKKNSEKFDSEIRAKSNILKYYRILMALIMKRC